MFVIFCFMIYMSFLFALLYFFLKNIMFFVYVYDFPVRKIDKMRVSVVEIATFKDYG